MRTFKTILWIFILVGLTALLSPARAAQANAAEADPLTHFSFRRMYTVTPGDLITAMNALRVANGYQALIVDPIVMAVAQGTAEYMAANELSWHIGDVRGRIAGAGYGAGTNVFATENFAIGFPTIDEIMVAWADPDHMRPATNPSYCNVGAGVALSPNGMYYYILQAAYTSPSTCGSYTPPDDSGGGSTPPSGSVPGVSQIIKPVKVTTPDADGKTFHVVEAGQSFWAIAIAYHVTIRDLEVWNNLSRDNALKVGQRLFIPGSNTEGYATPTPVGMFAVSTPDADGKIVHTVAAYQTLITIAEAYEVTLEALLSLNGWQEDWPLQIGQKLLISPGWVTPSPTPRPLTPIEKLTPASDGNFYHVVQSGETLSWIARLYDISLAELMAWNGLNNASIIRPDEKLVLQVTPPATATRTPGPPTATFTVTRTPVPPTVTRTPTRPAPSPSPTATPVPKESASTPLWPVFIVMALAVLGVIGFVFRKKFFRS